MKYKVTKKQNNGKLCIVCGLKNDSGVQAEFYELENGEVAAVFTTKEEHQSYPGRLHGGISSAILDETIGRAISVIEPDIWGVTIELSLKYRRPVPLGKPLKAVGRITKNSRRIFEGSGEILLENGDVAVTAEGKYMKMPLDKISEFEDEDEWVSNLTEDDLKEIDIVNNKSK